ncbi:MAG: VWA domain-containing protein [Candidatus Eremiobacterota bacterium]
MVVPFVYELRRRGVPVGVQEAVALAAALRKGLHGDSLDGFYHVSRSLLVHSENHLDAFDEAFLAHFKGVQANGIELQRQLLEWLKEAARREDLSPEERELLERYDPEELERMLQERLREQTERHDGGNRWIGTGGTSPFGHSGQAPSGFRVGGPGGFRQAFKSADARRYRGYRGDLVLDVRQYSMALRKLRSFSRDGSERELDVDGTIDATARNAGELEVVTRPPRRSNLRVILLMDVGGSMEPYSHTVEQLFSAAARATHFKEFRAFFFHNCVYGQVYRSGGLHRPASLDELFRSTGKHYRLILVGDALMAPYELMSPRGVYSLTRKGKSGLDWLKLLAEHYPRSVWLNPEREVYWNDPTSTLAVIRTVFPMYPLTLDGLERAVRFLLTGRR